MIKSICKFCFYSILLLAFHCHSENIDFVSYDETKKRFLNLDKTYVVTNEELENYLDDINSEIKASPHNPYLVFLKSDIVRAKLGKNVRTFMAEGHSRVEAIKKSVNPSKEEYLAILKEALDIHDTAKSDYQLNRFFLHSIAQYSNSVPELMERAIKARIARTQIEDFGYWGSKDEPRERPEVFSWPEYLYQSYLGLIEVNWKLGRKMEVDRLIMELRKRIKSNEKNFQTPQNEEYYLKLTDQILGNLERSI